VSAPEFCIAARDELRHDVFTGELYETGHVLCCTAKPEPHSLYCSSCQPRSANRGAPYLVRWGYLGRYRQEHATFEEAFKHYASLRQRDFRCGDANWPVDIYGAGADDESDGLDDYERERLGELP
jgi:hypothetical protein